MLCSLAEKKRSVPITSTFWFLSIPHSIYPKKRTFGVLTNCLLGIDCWNLLASGQRNVDSLLKTGIQHQTNLHLHKYMHCKMYFWSVQRVSGCVSMHLRSRLPILVLTLKPTEIHSIVKMLCLALEWSDCLQKTLVSDDFRSLLIHIWGFFCSRGWNSNTHTEQA